jgi:hypothetical protein
MDKDAYKRLLAEQAKERADLEKKINDECATKAKELAIQKAKAPNYRPPWAPKATYQEFYPHELAVQKRQRAPELAKLDAKHQAIRQDIEKERPALALDRLSPQEKDLAKRVDAKPQAVEQDIEKSGPTLAHKKLSPQEEELAKRKAMTFELQPAPGPKLPGL